ncbi:MAG TPA: DJ-1/PfpI family protein [Aeromicrobium sp.]|nr:DJ-1/PfpI family protein [Aeromicrobium sp.]
MSTTADWTTSVCSGSVILAAAGLLTDRRATSHWITLPVLKTFGAVPVGDERIVVEDRIATAAGVSAGMDLGLWLTAQIGGEERARAVQLGLEYDPQPPFDSGHVSRASRRSKAMATAMLSRDVVRTGQLGAATQMAWGRTINAVRTASARRRRGSSGR